jgi:hypothetical protein
MTAGARITDSVAHFRNRGNFKSAVRLLRNRSPERLRWRAAVTALASDAGRMTGGERMRVEEPIRELVLDARLHRVDLDRGEVLPRWSFGDLCRLSCVARADLQSLRRYVKLPTEFEAAIDTAAVVLAGRAFSAMLHQRAQRLWLSVPDEDGPEPLMMHHRYIIERANRDAETGKRWGALAKALLVQPTV